MSIRIATLMLLLALAAVGCDNQQAKLELPNWFGEKHPVEVQATLAEIDAVAALKSDSAKYDGFKAIASRPGLSDPAQVYLVRPVIDELYSPDDTQEVLLLLIDNPAFCHAAKKEILDHLGRISSEKHKIVVLKAINEINM